MMPFVTTLATSLPEAPGFADNVQYQVTGFLVVLFALASIALVVWLVGRVFIVRDRYKEIAAQVASQEAAEEAAHIPGEIFAVIAAAVQVALENQSVVIHGVRSDDPRTNLAWSAEGRRSIYASKNLR